MLLLLHPRNVSDWNIGMEGSNEFKMKNMKNVKINESQEIEKSRFG